MFGEETLLRWRQNVRIYYSPQYLYLGAWFSDEANMNTVMILHEKSGEAQMNKFAIFCYANTIFPNAYKWMVFDTAITASQI